MEQTLFDDLVQSLKEAKAISRGETPASRWTKVTQPDMTNKPDLAACQTGNREGSTPE